MAPAIHLGREASTGRLALTDLDGDGILDMVAPAGPSSIGVILQR